MGCDASPPNNRPLLSPPPVLGTQLRGFSPEAALFDAALGILSFRALGGKFAAVLPSDLAFPVSRAG